MEIEKNKIDSGFKIVNLLLMESSFSREVTVSFDPHQVESIVNIDVNVQVNQNTVYVTETLDYSQKVGNKNQVMSKIKMAGVFEKIGTNALDMDNFGRVNGAAIIFPYIREHLTNLSSKAALGLIILPPFNFTKSTTIIK